MSIVQPGPELDIILAEKLGISVHIATGEKLSTTWNGMQLVVEDMQRRGWKFTLEIKHTIHASFENDEIIRSAMFYDSVPLSVCIAALSALGALEGQADER